MPEYGINPIVITRQWKNKFGNTLDYVAPGESDNTITEESADGVLVKSPYYPNIANRILLKYGENRFTWLRRIISAYYEFMQFILPVGPKIEIFKAADEYLKNNKVDCIVATGDPFILFHYASILGQKHKIPWIADYRDPWSHDISKQNKILNIWSTYYEKKIVRNAAFIVTVSDFVKQQISSIIEHKAVHIITNGYDPEVIDQTSGIAQNSDTLSIALAGSIYKWNPINSFLSVISKFISSNPQKQIRINFYGINIKDELEATLNSEFPNIKSSVQIYPKMEYEQLIQELARNNLMLLFNYYSYIGTKIYDYIGIRRSILMCYSDESTSSELKDQYYNVEEIPGISETLQEDLIREIRGGYIAKDEDDLYNILNQLHDEFSKNKSITCHTINSEHYSRKHQIKRLSELIKGIA